MRSGKSEELIRHLNRAKWAKMRILVIKPHKDDRTENEIASRVVVEDGTKDFVKSSSFPAVSIETREEIEELFKKEQPDVLGVDEAQFFDTWFFDFIVALLRKKRNTKLQVLVAGLDMDAWGRPFGIMPNLMALADEVQKETAICSSCGAHASFTQILQTSNEQIQVGDAGIYEARCRVCHEIPENIPSIQEYVES